MAVIVKCPQCGKEMKAQGLAGHLRNKHEQKPLEDRIAQLEARLADAGVAVPQVEKPVGLPVSSAAPAAPPTAVSPSEEDRLAVLADWLGGMTKDAWVKIGEEAGYFDEEPAAAVVADVAAVPALAPAPATEQPTEKPTKLVYLPKTGLIVKVEA